MDLKKKLSLSTLAATISLSSLALISSAAVFTDEGEVFFIRREVKSFAVFFHRPKGAGVLADTGGDQ